MATRAIGEIDPSPPSTGCRGSAAGLSGTEALQAAVLRVSRDGMEVADNPPGDFDDPVRSCKRDPVTEGRPTIEMSGRQMAEPAEFQATT